jgi:rhodanese-related sulfurtransferase
MHLPYRRKNPELEISVDEVARLRNEGLDVTIIDVREQDEWDAGRMPDTTLIPLGDLATRLHELDAEDSVVIICQSGIRSLVAAELLTQWGFKDAKSMAGGLIEWVQASHEIV